MFTKKGAIQSGFLCSIVLNVIILCLTAAPLLAQTDWIQLYYEDFEDGTATEWVDLNASSTWTIEEESGNKFLRGNQAYAVHNAGHPWTNYLFEAKIRLVDNGLFVHFRNKSDKRYLIEFSINNIYLMKELNDQPIGLQRSNPSLTLQEWYLITICAEQGHIQIFLDNKLEIDYLDQDYIAGGTLVLETFGQADFDDLKVMGPGAPPEYKWIRTGGPSGGLGYDIRMHPRDKNIMFVTDVPSGVNKSYDGGETWVQKNTGIIREGWGIGPAGDGYPVFSLTFDSNNPDIVWAGTQEAGALYKSTDGGETWIKKSQNGIDSRNALSFRGFAVHPQNSNIVLAAGEIFEGEDPFDGGQRGSGLIYKTNDSGENWYLVWEGESLARVLIYDYTNPDIVYCSTGIFDRVAINGIGVGILKSTDGGETWFTINDGLENYYVGFMEMHPTNPNILFAACQGPNSKYGGTGGGVYRTYDGGKTWSFVMAEEGVTVVTISKSHPNTIYAGNLGTFYRSDDGGDTWKKFHHESEGRSFWGPPGVAGGFPISAVVDPVNPMKVFVNNYGGGNFVSLDGGKTWQNSSKGYSGANIRDISISPQNPNLVYIVAVNGPFFSSNGGDDWIGIGNDADVGFFSYSVCSFPDNPSEVLVGLLWSGVIVKSYDGGNTWNEVFRHADIDPIIPPGQGFASITIAPSNPDIVYAGMRADLYHGALESFGIYKSTNRGENWQEMNSGLENSLKAINIIRAHPTNPDIAYAGMVRDGIYKTIDGGQNWLPVNNGLSSSDIRSLAIDPKNPETIYAGSGDGKGVFKSTNGGDLWLEENNKLQLVCPSYLSPIGRTPLGIDLELPRIIRSQGYYNIPWTNVTDIVIDPTNTQNVYIADLNTGVYLSSNAGKTWVQANEGISNRAVTQLAISADGKVLYAGTFGGGVCRMVLGQNRAPQVSSTVPALADTVYLTTGDSLLFEVWAYDLNNDTLLYSWTLDNKFLEGITTSNYFLNTTNLVLGNHSLKFDIADADTLISVIWDIKILSPTIVNKDQHPNIPKSFALMQNYPNPFNPITTIKYLLPKSAKVVIKVYNLLGQEIKTIVNDQKEAGYFTISWDGKDRNEINVSSGIYLYKINAISEKQHFIQTKKMVLLQ